MDERKEMLAQALRDYPTWGDAFIAEKERADKLRKGLEEVRLRHMYNQKEAGEGLAVWVLNGNDPDGWKPKSSDYGYESECKYQELQMLNQKIRDRI